MTVPEPGLRSPSTLELKYTSTGRKFWFHQEQMDTYATGTGNTAISTHIAPEGACNLSCPYCSVTYRDTHSRIDFYTVLDYILRLKERGLKAVILTGGGEPTAYPDFNRLVRMICLLDLRVALITNGTLAHKVEDDVWGAFDWVRVSINFFENWESRILVPRGKMRSDCVVGLSTVFTHKHERPEELRVGWKKIYKKVKLLADAMDAQYVRVLPNCLLPQEQLLASHRDLDLALAEVEDDRFFQQNKVHRAPVCNTCHQSFFRPYLSEESNPWDGKPGTVFPCDSVVLNAPVKGAEGYGKFMRQYAICRPSEVGNYLDGKIKTSFVPSADCAGCVFTETVEMLGRWKDDGVSLPASGSREHHVFV